MTPPLTVQQRSVRAACDAMTTELEASILVELQRLWRDLIVRLHHLDGQRGAQPMRKRLAKTSYLSADLWWLFQHRLKNRIMDAILKGTITLAMLQNAHLLARAGRTVNIDPEAFAQDFESELGLRISQVTDTLRRQAAKEVVRWYNTPGQTLGDLVGKLQPQFGSYRAQMIARTEIGNLNSGVNEKIATALGVTEWWFESRRDEIVCTQKLKGPDGRDWKGCKSLHGQVFKIGQKMPPLHPGCRCTGHLIVPAVEAPK